MFEAPMFNDVISIHALREESDKFVYYRQRIRQISIHALREESDRAFALNTVLSWIFLSTLSVRRATGLHFFVDDYQFISIHALREESDRRLRYRTPRP